MICAHLRRWSIAVLALVLFHLGEAHIRACEPGTHGHLHDARGVIDVVGQSTPGQGQEQPPHGARMPRKASAWKQSLAATARRKHLQKSA